jgi:hypothetical protein
VLILCASWTLIALTALGIRLSYRRNRPVGDPS